MPGSKSRAYRLTEIASVLLMVSGVVLYFWRLNSSGNAEKLSGAAPWLPRPQESLTAWLYIAPALIGLLMFIVAEVLLQYKDSDRWGQAVLGALVSWSLVGFTILFGLLFGVK